MAKIVDKKINSKYDFNQCLHKEQKKIRQSAKALVAATCFVYLIQILAFKFFKAL